MPFHRVPVLPLAVAGMVFCAACKPEPKPDVRAAASPAATLEAATAHGSSAAPGVPVQPAPPIPSGAVMPPGHPPIGPAGQPGAVVPAPPIAPGAVMPPGHPPVGPGPGQPAAMAPAAPLPIVPPGGVGPSALAWTVPGGWTAETPANPTRRAQYRVPGPGGDGECVVYYFGPGQGGDAASNAERWASQFAQPDGRDPLSAMRTRRLSGGTMGAVIVETSGNYLAGSMTGGAVQRMEGWALLGAIVEGPDASWYFKLTGPKASIDAQRAAFEKMLRSLKRGS